MVFKTPADIGALDFQREEVAKPDDLAAAWDQTIDGYIQGFDTNDGHAPGAVEISPNYFDARQEAPTGGPAAIPWNGFPRALDRWHKVLADPTPQKMALAERTADAVPERLYWFTQKAGERPELQEVEAHILPLLSADTQALAKRLRLGGPNGPDVSIRYRQQDEYVEWHADRDAGGRLTRLSFTSEPPEYWRMLAQKREDGSQERALVVALYKDLIGHDVPEEDLFYPDDVYVHGRVAAGQLKWLRLYERGEYNPYNRWNTTHGAVHLTHRANTLGAEVNLAAVAANVWAADGEEPGDQFDNDPALSRIACAGYGEINRSSDPRIGEQVGLQVNGGNRVSLNDPIGLYMSRLDLTSLQRETAPGVWTPVDPNEVMQVVRGQAGGATPRILHLKLEAPAGADWTLADCRLEQRPLERGGQVARKISMVIYADIRAGGVDTTPVGCMDILVCRHPQSPGLFGSVQDANGLTCPDLSDTYWQSVQPYEGAAGPTPVVHAIVEAEPEAVAGDERVLRRTRVKRRAIR